MYMIHIDLLYIRTRTNFHTDVVIKNNRGDVLGVCRPLYLSSKKIHSGYYSFPFTIQGKQHAMTVPFTTDSEKSLSIFQVLPDTQALHFLCSIDISYNIICFKSGVFSSEHFPQKAWGAAVYAHKSSVPHRTPNPRREFVHLPSALSSLKKHARSSEARVFENPSLFFDQWHLDFYRGVYELVHASFLHHSEQDTDPESLSTSTVTTYNAETHSMASYEEEESNTGGRERRYSKLAR